MWKLQQLLFLVSRKRGIGIKKMGGTGGEVLGGSVQSWKLGVAGQVRRSSKEKRQGGDGDLGCPKTLGSQGRFQNRNGMCQGQSRGERAVGAPGGGPTWQSIMASSSFSSIFFSPVSAHRRASRTGPSGRPPSFFRGASQSVDKAIGGQVEKLSLEDPSNCPGEGTMLFAEGKRLSHSQPATDSKIQPHITGKGAQTLGKTQPDPQILSDTQEEIRPDPCIYLDTWRIPQPDPHLHLDEYGEIQTVKQDTHEHTHGRYRQII